MLAACASTDRGKEERKRRKERRDFNPYLLLLSRSPVSVKNALAEIISWKTGILFDTLKHQLYRE